MLIELLNFDLLIRRNHFIEFQMKIFLIIWFDVKRTKIENFTVKIDIFLNVFREGFLS